MWEQQARVEELDSDDTDTQGVGLDFGNKRFASDPLHFTGVDLATASRARRVYSYDTESTEASEESEHEGTNALQIALRDKEEALVRSALARIRRAQEKGKRQVKLNQDELDALERRRKRMQSAATAKSRKESGGSGGSGNEKKRRSEKQLITVPISSVDLTSRKGKSKRIEEAQPHHSVASNPPGILVPGVDGPVYAPVGYYPPPAGGNRSSPSRPRSASQQFRPPLPPQFGYEAQLPRHFSDGTRPTSSSSTSSRRPLPDEEGWMPGYSRRSSVSSNSYMVDPFEYQTSSGHPPAMPQQYMQSQSARRNVSGPEVSYSSVRRTPPVASSSVYPTSSRAPASDPLLRRRDSGRDELALSATSSEEDTSDDLGNGVQVFVEEGDRDRAAAVPRKAAGSSKGSKKKGKGK